MRTIKEFIFTVNFRHAFAVFLLVCFMTLCYWRKNDEKLSSLDSQITLVGTLLALAVKRYFDKPDEQKTNTDNKGQVLPIISNLNGDNCRGNTCPNPSCGLPKA